MEARVAGGSSFEKVENPGCPRGPSEVLLQIFARIPNYRKIRKSVGNVKQNSADVPIVRYRFFRVSLIYSVVALLVPAATFPVDDSLRSAGVIAMVLLLLSGAIAAWVMKWRAYFVMRESPVLLVVLACSVILLLVLDGRLFSPFQQATIGVVFLAATVRGIRTGIAVGLCCAGIPVIAIAGLLAEPPQPELGAICWVLFGWLPVTALSAWTVGTILESHDEAVGELSSGRGQTSGDSVDAQPAPASEPRQIKETPLDLNEAPAATVDSNITDRQRDVAEHLTRGLTNAQIASSLGISSRTVQAHVRALLEATGTANRTQLAVATAVAEELAWESGPQ